MTMIKKQARTNIEKLGFVDSDLYTSTHDDIMLWLDSHAENLINILPERIPDTKLQIEKKWEVPLINRNHYTEGFIDFALTAKQYIETEEQLKIYNKKFKEEYRIDYSTWDHFFEGFFEVKTSIESLGALLRQLNFYNEVLKKNGSYNHPIIVVSPDTKFIKTIREQGFGFITYPTHFDKKG